MRVDLYGLVHKAQRFKLFTFAQELSRASLEPEPVRERLRESVRDIVRMLSEHARIEERYIHPLFAELGQPAATLEREHQELEVELTALSRIVDDGRWSELYRAVMRFIGEYLLHIDEEERAQSQLLWPSFTDEQLRAVFRRFQSERAPSEAERDLELFLPALSVEEAAALLGRVTDGASAEARKKVFALARAALGEERWNDVERRFAQTP